MVGYGPNKGLVPKLCERLFQAIRENQESRQCQVKSVAALSSLMCRCETSQCLCPSCLHAGLFQYVGNLQRAGNRREKQLISCFFLFFFCVSPCSFSPPSSLSRWLTCCLGGLALRGGSESERSSREASMWRASEQSRVKTHHR